MLHKLYLSKKYNLIKGKKWTSLAVPWLRFRAPSAGGAGSIPGWGIKIPHAVQCSQNFFLKKGKNWGFPGGAVVENLPANAGDTGSSPGLGRSHMPRSD